LTGLLLILCFGLAGEVREGSPADPAFWAFRPPRRPELPAVKREEWCRNPIDRFILARLEREGLSPSPEASRPVLIRRMSLDLLGLPPSPEEVDRFVRDESPEALKRLVDRLLASPRYGERWARHWLDVVRFAETDGFETNTPRPNAWPYRDYVIRALNEDRPYPRFVLEQLAGDAVGEEEATGFLVGGPYDTVKSPDPGLTLEQRAQELHDMVSTAGTAFLGLTVGCARCHNHKFDPITQRDYYAMAAVFAGVEHGERPLPWPDQEERDRQVARAREELAGLEKRFWELEPLADLSPGAGAAPARGPVHPLRNVDRFGPVEARFVRFTVLATNNLEPCLDELEVYSAGPEPRNVALQSAGGRASASSEFPNAEIHKIAHLNDGEHGNSKSWISSQPGGGWAQIELAAPAVIDRVVWGRDREGKFADRLAVSYRIEVGLEPGSFRTVASSLDRKPYQSGHAPETILAGKGNSAEETARAGRLLERKRDLDLAIARSSAKRMIYAGLFKEPRPIHRLERGDPLAQREVVGPEAIAVLGNPWGLAPDAPERERRLALARWIGDPANPLTARVLVNRIWHYHFGQGIVATPSDFGANGARPSHPELLDWLATELVENGWRPKPIHRLILLSSSYRQSSLADPAALSRDAGSRLLWRFPPRRLEAEPIRDSILSVSGKLDLTMGGPGYEVFEPNTNYVRVYIPKEKFGPPEWRRMVYQTKPRKEQDSTFGAFDCPDGCQTAPRRGSSTNALQALNLLNSSFVMEQAGFLAERVLREAGTTHPDLVVTRAFRLALGREPDPEERWASVRMIQGQGLRVLCRALLNSSEFIFLD
jgi:hypothetical protein